MSSGHITSDDEFHLGVVDVWNDLEGIGIVLSKVRPDGVWFHYTTLSTLFGPSGEWLREGDPVEFTFEDVDQDGFHSRAISICPTEPVAIAARPLEEPESPIRPYASRLKFR